MVDNKRIVKNTVFLYIRMFLLMGISLYTSRVVLDVLGVEDYGIYNIVGSIVVLFSFINNALTSSTRRFINFSLGSGGTERTREIFATSFVIHIIIAGIVLILAETAGLWWLNNCLNIPPGRMHAANMVYQFSILASCIGIIGTPFEASIVAYERMGIYAYISVAEGCLKLLAVFLLAKAPADKLILYAFLILVIGVLVYLYKWAYCIKRIPACRISFRIDRTAFREMLSFSGWSLLGQIAFVGSTTGLNMLINIFFGVALNAAIGIAQQINSAIYSFVTNFQTAFNPQLVQTYSSGDMENHRTILSRSSRISYYLLFMIAVPVIFNMDFILDLWLKQVPEYTAAFAVLTVLYSLFDAIGAPVWMSMQATGKIRRYQVIISLINLSVLPLSYLALKAGYDARAVFVLKLMVGAIMYIFRINYILPKVGYRIKDYLRQVLLPVAGISICVPAVVYAAAPLFAGDVARLISTTVLSVLLSGAFLFTCGIDKEERKALIATIKTVITR